MTNMINPAALLGFRLANRADDKTIPTSATSKVGTKGGGGTTLTGAISDQDADLLFNQQ